jgi:hypothetical protein
LNFQITVNVLWNSDPLKAKSHTFVCLQGFLKKPKTESRTLIFQNSLFGSNESILGIKSINLKANKYVTHNIIQKMDIKFYPFSHIFPEN